MYVLLAVSTAAAPPIGKLRNSLFSFSVPALIGCCGRTSSTATAEYFVGSRKEKAYPETVVTKHRAKIKTIRRRKTSNIVTGSISAEPVSSKAAKPLLYHKIRRVVNRSRGEPAGSVRSGTPAIGIAP